MWAGLERSKTSSYFDSSSMDFTLTLEQEEMIRDVDRKIRYSSK